MTQQAVVVDAVPGQQPPEQQQQATFFSGSSQTPAQAESNQGGITPVNAVLPPSQLSAGLMAESPAIVDAQKSGGDFDLVPGSSGAIGNDATTTNVNPSSEGSNSGTSSPASSSGSGLGFGAIAGIVCGVMVIAVAGFVGYRRSGQNSATSKRVPDLEYNIDSNPNDLSLERMMSLGSMPVLAPRNASPPMARLPSPPAPAKIKESMPNSTPSPPPLQQMHAASANLDSMYPQNVAPADSQFADMPRDSSYTESDLYRDSMYSEGNPHFLSMYSYADSKFEVMQSQDFLENYSDAPPMVEEVRKSSTSLFDDFEDEINSVFRRSQNDYSTSHLMNMVNSADPALDLAAASLAAASQDSSSPEAKYDSMVFNQLEDTDSVISHD